MMIVPVTGNVKYQITLDPSVWIFDERRIKFEDAFSAEAAIEKFEQQEVSFSSAERFNREVVQATNNNKPIPRKDADEILKSTYVMPFTPFYRTVEVQDTATDATIFQGNGNEVTLPLHQLENSYLLFALDGKPLREDGPVHIYFTDGSNKENPIKSVKKIVIK